MTFLAREIWACLAAAFLTGAVTGWLLRGTQARRNLKKLEKVYRINMASLESKKPKK